MLEAVSYSRYLIQYIVFLVLGLSENRILDGIDGHTFDPACGIFRYC